MPFQFNNDGNIWHPPRREANESETPIKFTNVSNSSYVVNPIPPFHINNFSILFRILTLKE